MATIRHMATSEIDRIGEIDRSERITQQYSYRHGSLESRAVDVRARRWSTSGDHEHSVQGLVDGWQPILDRGGLLIGAFDAETFAGFAIYRPRISDDTANLSALYVSRSHRRKGIASLLTAEVVRLARTSKARHLYVSATPSGPTIDFYQGHGFEPTDEPNEVLYAAEPDDIHMILKL